MDNYNTPQGMPAYNGGQQPYSYMGFGDAVKKCLNNYATFSGRAGRAEYWWFFLFQFVVAAVFTTLLTIFAKIELLTYIIMGLNYLVSLALIVPTLAVAWRRMHDIGKGGGWYFINLIPLVGTIIWIVWCCRKGEPVPNRFGEPVA